jgi:hypothetical protein
LEQFIFYGGYPGAAPLVHDETRWAAYVSDALIETTISKDVLLMVPVQKPALLRRVFDLACVYSGQILSYQKMLGQLDDAGNTTTLAPTSTCSKAQAWPAACPNTWAKWCASGHPAPSCKCSTTP